MKIRKRKTDTSTNTEIKGNIRAEHCLRMVPWNYKKIIEKHGKNKHRQNELIHE